VASFTLHQQNVPIRERDEKHNQLAIGASKGSGGLHKSIYDHNKLFLSPPRLVDQIIINKMPSIDAIFVVIIVTATTLIIFLLGRPLGRCFSSGVGSQLSHHLGRHLG
jgi:hypothetical protein